MRATLTIRRLSRDLTVDLTVSKGGKFKVHAAIDENGKTVQLTPWELEEATRRVRAGEDESGI